MTGIWSLLYLLAEPQPALQIYQPSSAADLENSRHGQQLVGGHWERLRSCCQPKGRLQRASLALLCGRAAAEDSCVLAGPGRGALVKGAVSAWFSLPPAHARQLWQAALRTAL